MIDVFDHGGSLDDELARMREVPGPPDDVRPLVTRTLAKRQSLRGFPLDLAEETKLLWLETDGWNVGNLIRAYLDTDEEFISHVREKTLREFEHIG